MRSSRFPSLVAAGLAAAALAAAGFAALAPAAARAPVAPAPAGSGRGTEPFLRGMIVSCPRWGPIWGSPAMADSLAELSRLGVEWVAIHPYAWVQRDGRVEFRPTAETPFLARAVELARAAGVELFWKPHLGYWGSFAWRGDIGFDSDAAAWERFFDGYRRFIVDQAAFAERAGLRLLAVGVELEGTTGHESEWRRTIAEVRRVYSGRLTYAANWDSLERVPFWDAVDWIGVHAYFPLAAGDEPDDDEIQRGWDRHLATLAALSRRHGRDVLLAEVGYNRAPEAAREPWSYRTEDSPASRRLRQRLIEAAVVRAEGAPFVRGMFWWKWIPGTERGRRNFSMRDEEAVAALGRHWARAAAVASGER